MNTFLTLLNVGFIERNKGKYHKNLAVTEL